MAYSTRRYNYDEEGSSTQNLWIIVLVVGAMVGAFLFGRYVLGDRLRQDAAGPAEQADAPLTQPTAETPPPATDPATVTAELPTTDEPAGTTPEEVSIVTGDNEAALTDQLPQGTRELEAAMDDEVAAREAARRKEDEARRKKEEEAERREAEQQAAQRREAERKKKEEAERRRREEEARRTAQRPPTANRPAPAPAGSGTRPAPQPAEPAAGATTPPAPSSRMLRVRAGSFDSRDAASERQRQLKDKGHDALLVVREEGGRQVYDVQVGAYESRTNADAMAAQLRQDGFDASVGGN